MTGAHALIDAYGGFYMMNTLLEAISNPAAVGEHKWGSEASNLFRSLNAYTDSMRGGKSVSEEAGKAMEKAKREYGSKGAVGLRQFFQLSCGSHCFSAVSDDANPA